MTAPEHISDALPVRASASMPRRRPNMVAGGLSVAIVVLLAVATLAIFASHAAHPTTGAATNLTPPTPGSQDALTGISMTSATDGWAVGRHVDHNTQIGSVFLYHYTSEGWRQVSIAVPPDAYNNPPKLDAVSMVNAHDGWAVGFADEDALLLHYDGMHWNRVASPFHGELSDVQMISADEGWITTEGVSYPLQSPSILHYTHGQWTIQYQRAYNPNPANAQSELAHLSMVSSQEGWAIGTDATGKGGATPDGIILHYLNGTWSVQTSFVQERVRSIAMASATDGWAGSDRNVAIGNNTYKTVPVLYHYSGGEWHEAPSALSPASSDTFHVEIDAIHMLSQNDGWLGNGGTIPNDGNAYLYHYNGTVWQLVKIPVQVSNRHGSSAFSFAFLPNGEGWAAGATGFPPALDGAATSGVLILHDVNGIWTVQLS